MKKKPNILLITCDQLQAVATGCYGNPDVRTPNINALAEAEVRFSHGISNAPVCMAGRSVLLSGQYNRSCTGGIGNVGYRQGKVGSYPMPEYPAPGRLHFPNATLPELLRTAGYRTAAIGKWHIYTLPDVIGFDHYVIPRTHKWVKDIYGLKEVEDLHQWYHSLKFLIEHKDELEIDLYEAHKDLFH